jgi:hypothetical protein
MTRPPHRECRANSKPSCGSLGRVIMDQAVLPLRRGRLALRRPGFPSTSSKPQAGPQRPLDASYTGRHSFHVGQMEIRLVCQVGSLFAHDRLGDDRPGLRQRANLLAREGMVHLHRPAGSRLTSGPSPTSIHRRRCGAAWRIHKTEKKMHGRSDMNFLARFSSAACCRLPVGFLQRHMRWSIKSRHLGTHSTSTAYGGLPRELFNLCAKSKTGLINPVKCTGFGIRLFLSTVPVRQPVFSQSPPTS